jgi:hypothetical protein
MKRYQVQFQGRSRVKALMDTDDFAAALSCMDSQAPEGWVLDTNAHPERWIA